MNIGTPGSGVPSLMRRLWEINRVEIAGLRLSHEEQTPATVSFLNGEIDALVFVSSPEAPMVQMLLQTPGVRLASFAQSEAYARRLRFLSPVVLPRGVVDLAADLPPEDVRLVATTTSLLARDGTHPALLQLFSQAAAKLMAKGEGQAEASMVKAYVCKAAEWVTREAMQIHGGMGYAEEYDVSRYFVDARVLSIFEGADETLCLKVIARRLVENHQKG